MITLTNVLDPENWDRAITHCRLRHSWSKRLKERLRWIAYSSTDPVHRALRSGQYRPERCRVRAEPKPGGGERVLRIPRPRDMVIARAIVQVLTLVVHVLLATGCAAYRPHRGQHHAVLAARAAARDYPWSVGTDVRACFDSVRQDLVLADLDRHRLVDQPVRALIRAFLGRMPGGVGLMTGCPLSPVLLNLHLRAVDLVLEAEGAPWLRYSDNLLLPGKTRQHVHGRLEVLREALAPLGMELHTRKTTVCLTRQAEFLGFRLGDLHPTGRAIRRHRRRLRETVCNRPRRVLDFVKGWVEYFSLCPDPGLFVAFDQFADRAWDGWPWDLVYTRSSARLSGVVMGARGIAWNAMGRPHRISMGSVGPANNARLPRIRSLASAAGIAASVFPMISPGRAIRLFALGAGSPPAGCVPSRACATSACSTPRSAFAKNISPANRRRSVRRATSLSRAWSTVSAGCASPGRNGASVSAATRSRLSSTTGSVGNAGATEPPPQP
ncbi:MAG: hypothetical protein HY319_01010 [Armatimonadetes bacterium]|nr:hypothetical protein [Armatimonadota bacterium]